MKVVDSNRLLRGFCWARLALAAVLLALAPAVSGDAESEMNPTTLSVALLAAVLSSGAVLLLTPLSKPRRMAWLMCLLDAALITAVVAATGGPRSLFTFLYVLSVTAGCVLLSRTGGLAIAAGCSALYTGLVLGRTIFPLTAFFEAPKETTALEVLTMFLNAGTFLIVAIVAGGFAERFQLTHEELETRRRDLRDLAAFKDLVFQSVGTGLIAVDRQHTITAFNGAAEEITGIAAHDAVGRPWTFLFGDAVPIAAIEVALGEQARGAPRHETTIVRPDGTSVPVRMTFSPLRAGDGSRVGLISACEDLSAIRDMETRMRQADRLATLGRMAANIAHEIRNPLASLTGAIEVLTSGTPATESRERLAQIVVKESGRLNGIIKDFLEYARPAPLARSRINVAECLDEVLVLLEHRAAPGTLKIVREFPAALPWSVDPHQFRQAIWNLCLNAFQAMPEGGELRVGALEYRGRLELRVSDSGDGIGTADVGHIFEPFFSTKAGGSGLGLALVHRVVQEHGGEIEVHSVSGAGATFTITLPPADA
jgi:two-component system sensor histidine kinase PilS (NtrC family)